MKPRSAPPPLEFRQRESVREGFARLAAEMAASAKDLSTVSAKEFPSAVHAVRLSIKRSRALLRLGSDALGVATAKKARTRLRTAARRLAVRRDLDVAQAVLQRLAAENAGERQAAVRTVLAGYPAATATRTPQESRVRADLRKAASELRSLSIALQKARWKTHGWAALESGLLASARRARRRFRKAHTTDAEGAFHAWRTSVKVLQYHVAYLRPAAPKALGAIGVALDRLGSCLGTENDLAQLAAQLAKNPDGFGDRKATEKVRALLVSRQQFQRKQALKLGRKLFARRATEFVEEIRRAWKTWRRG